MNPSLVRLFAIVATSLADLGEAPSGLLYACLGNEGSFNDYQIVETTLLRGEFATKNGYMLTITEKGRKLAAELDAALAKPAL